MPLFTNPSIVLLSQVCKSGLRRGTGALQPRESTPSRRGVQIAPNGLLDAETTKHGMNSGDCRRDLHYQEWG